MSTITSIYVLGLFVLKKSFRLRQAAEIQDEIVFTSTQTSFERKKRQRDLWPLCSPSPPEAGNRARFVWRLNSELMVGLLNWRP